MFTYVMHDASFGESFEMVEEEKYLKLNWFKSLCTMFTDVD